MYKALVGRLQWDWKGREGQSPRESFQGIRFERNSRKRTRGKEVCEPHENVFIIISSVVINNNNKKNTLGEKLCFLLVKYFLALYIL